MMPCAMVRVGCHPVARHCHSSLYIEHACGIRAASLYAPGGGRANEWPFMTVQIARFAEAQTVCASARGDQGRRTNDECQHSFVVRPSSLVKNQADRIRPQL